MNLGSDADPTVLYEKIAGASYGASKVPEGWPEKLARREEMAEIPERLAEGRTDAAPP